MSGGHDRTIGRAGLGASPPQDGARRPGEAAPTTPLAFHPLADIFPLLVGAELEALTESIRVNGLTLPIILHGKKILDGRNRYQACVALGIEPRCEQLQDGADPVRYVIDANVIRRHLDESQRAMVAARIANMQRGNQPKAKSAKSRISQADAGALLNVSERSANAAAAVQKTAAPEVVAKVDAGELGVYVAAELAKLPPEEQKALAALPAAQISKDVKIRAKAARRAEREQGLAVTTRAAAEALGQKFYNVIYADPPWRFEPYSRETGVDRAADNHYRTLTTEEICAVTLPAAPCSFFGRRCRWSTWRMPLWKPGASPTKASSSG
jgi:hypothetical protein